MLTIGTKVLIRKPEKAAWWTKGMLKYDGMSTTISKVTRSKSTAQGYELKGIKSERGVPYSFVADDLIEMKEAK